MVQDNVLYTFIGSVWSTTRPNATGEIGIEIEGGDFSNASLAGLTFRIVKYNDSGELEFSPWIKDSADSIVSTSSHVYSAPVQAVKTLTIGAAGVAANELYTFWLVIKDTLTTFGNKAMMKHGVYKTVIAAEAKGVIADNLVKNFDANMAREPEEFVVAEVRSAAAGAALGAAADTVVGTAGQKTVVVTDTAADSSCTAVVAGDYFRPGVAVTDEIYLVTASTVAITGGTMTLNRPLVNDVSLAGDASEVVTIAAEAAAATTIVFTGQARTNFEAGIWKYMVYDFDLLPGETGTVVDTQNAFQGTYTENQLKELEWFSKGNRGYGYRVDVIPVATQLTSQAVYTVCVNADGQKMTYLKVRDAGYTNVVGQSPGSLAEILVAMPSAQTILMNINLNTANNIAGLTAA